MDSFTEQRGHWLVESLNGLSESSQLGQILHLCQELDELHQKRPALADAWELSTYHRKTARIRREINSILAKHPFIPVLELSEYTPGAGGFSVRWWPDPKRPVEIVISKDVDFAPVGPHAAIQITLELLREGSLSRIRRCDNPACGKWFFATTNKKSVCNDACRVQKHQLKQGQANYMRDYRANPKVKLRKRRNRETT